MTAFERIAYNVGRRDEVPNQELARELAEKGDNEGVAEIAAHLEDPNKSIASDCIKVLYEVGYIEPSLIEPYTDTFIDLLGSRQNRMVWGGMIALWTVADSQYDAIWPRIDEVIAAVEKGSVITAGTGVKVLAIVGSKGSEQEGRLGPVLFGMLRDCEPKRLAPYAEDIMVMVNEGSANEFKAVLEMRTGELTRSQLARVRKLERALESI